MLLSSAPGKDLIDAAMGAAAAAGRDQVTALKLVAPIAIGVRPVGPADAEVFVTVNPLLRALLDRLGAVQIDERTFEIPTDSTDEARAQKLNATFDVIAGGHVFASDSFESRHFDPRGDRAPETDIPPFAVDGVTKPGQNENETRFRPFRDIYSTLRATVSAPAIDGKRLARFHEQHPVDGPLSGVMVVIQSPEQEGATALRISVSTNPVDREAGLLLGEGDDAVNVHVWPYGRDTRLPVRVSAERAAKAIADAERKGYPTVNADGTIKTFGDPTN